MKSPNTQPISPKSSCLWLMARRLLTWICTSGARPGRDLRAADQLAVASLYFGDDAFMKRSSILISATRLPSASFSAVSNHMYSVFGL